jgi:serine/threonine protein phosphatase 1
LVFLGDYIDRGANSADVIRIVRELQDARAGQVVCLKGNHEDMLLRSIDDADVAQQWLENNGGYETLNSFDGEVPHDVIDWMSKLPTLHEDEKHFYVHAGFRPGRPIAEQTDRDKLWIREPFLVADHDFGKHVVHGHTPQMSGQPDQRPHRTNLDTAAVYARALTAGVFTNTQDTAAEFLQVRWSWEV